MSDLQPRSVTIQTSIGELRLFAQRFEDIGPFSKLAPDDSASRRLRSYLPCIASRDAVTDADGPRVAIDEESCQQLSDEDVERVAEAYLSLPSVRKIADDQKLRSNPMERAAAEPATSYLDRLLRAEHDRQMEDPGTTYATFRERYGVPLSSALCDLDRQAVFLKETAANFIEEQDVASQARLAQHEASIRMASSAGVASGLPPPDESPIADFDRTTGDQAIGGLAGSGLGVHRSEREAEVELTRNIGWITAQSANLLSGLSESVTQFLRKFAEASEQSEAATRRLLRIAVAAIGVTAALSAGACVVALLSLMQQKEQQRDTTQWQESVLQTLKSNAATQDQHLKAVETRLQQLSARLELLPGLPVPAAAEAVPRNDTKDAAAQGRRDATKAVSAPRGAKRKATH